MSGIIAEWPKQAPKQKGQGKRIKVLLKAATRHSFNGYRMAPKRYAHRTEIPGLRDRHNGTEREGTRHELSGRDGRARYVVGPRGNWIKA